MGETVPETDHTVPERTGSYADQGELAPAQVLWSSVRAAETRLADARVAHLAAIEEARSARQELKHLRRREADLGVEDQAAAAELRQAEDTLRQRAVTAFVSNDTVAALGIVGSVQQSNQDRILELKARWVLLEAALDQDDQAIADYRDLRDRLDQDLVEALDQIRAEERHLDEADAVVVETSLAVDQAVDELEAFSAGSTIYIKGVVFPVAQPYDMPLINSWGFPRMPGTPDEHWHEGIDIFAPSGTPLLATERGVITRITNGRLGGKSLWLRGESGAHWYYAHLLDYADGLAVGTVVEAGDLVGYVGNTGNALTTPAHLHLQLHPDGGDPVNPYPLLNVVAERDHATPADHASPAISSGP